MSSPIVIDAISQATELIFSGDPVLWEIILLSFRVSLSALIIALLLGIPIALLMTVYQFHGRRLLHIAIDSLMALPPVVVGLIVYLILSRSGPLGIWGLLYTPAAMIIAQAVLITPIVVALSMQVFAQHWNRVREQLLMLGYQPRQSFGIILHEARLGLVTVILAAFGRAIAEIGAVMVVGGNIENHTRVMTTAVATETRQGNLTQALALGMILVALALLLNFTVHQIGHPKKTGKL